MGALCTGILGKEEILALYLIQGYPEMWLKVRSSNRYSLNIHIATISSLSHYVSTGLEI